MFDFRGVPEIPIPSASSQPQAFSPPSATPHYLHLRLRLNPEFGWDPIAERGYPTATDIISPGNATGKGDILIFIYIYVKIY